MSADKGSGFISRQSRIGMSHSYTLYETKTSSYLNTYITKCKIKGIELKNYTKTDWYYCIVEDGSVFKFHPDIHIFYELDLNELVWYQNQSFASLMHDTFLRYQEFSGFVDYYPHADDKK